MPDSNKRSQQLHASNISTSIAEGLEARVKDPLWFLARQWQTGEFEAENGGRPAGLSVTYRDFPFKSVQLGNEQRALDPADPLEAVIEAEEESGDAPAWRSEALEYEFDLTAQKHRFRAEEYSGPLLDWWHFSYAGKAPGANPKIESFQVTPTQMYFRGAPHPRWWRLEDADAYFDAPADPEPNALSMLLPEFFYADIDNWYIAPLPVTAGNLREMVDVKMVDSFGVVTAIGPATGDGSDAGWGLFALDPMEASDIAALDGRHLFVPNNALDILHNEELEEVRFLRDENANLVWAWEQRFIDEHGESITSSPGTEPGEGVDASAGDLPRYILKSKTPRHWIPYVPRQASSNPALDGEVTLRRGRTDENATPEKPQYRTRIVGESKLLFEEEVPVPGVRVRRIARFARGADGEAHFWIGRTKDAGRRTGRPRLRFDYISDEQ